MSEAPSAGGGLVFTSASVEETWKAAACVAGVVVQGDLVLLSGGLGAGKTTFVKGIVDALDCGMPATSPTFALVNVYRRGCCSSGGRAGTCRVAGEALHDGGDSVGGPDGSGPGEDISESPALGGDGGDLVAHVDLYRLESRREIEELAIGELLEEGAVALVEWGEAAAGVLGGDYLLVTIEPDSDYVSRRFSAVPAGDAWVGRMASLARALRGAGLEVDCGPEVGGGQAVDSGSEPDSGAQARTRFGVDGGPEGDGRVEVVCS